MSVTPLSCRQTNKEETVKAVAPVAEVIPIVLSDGRDAKVPGSHVCFVERAILPEYEHLKEDEDFMGYEEEHYNPVIDVEFLTYMHGCIDTAVLVDDQARSVHEQVMQRAQDEGKVLTLDGSNEEDEELYREYFQKVNTELVDIWPLATSFNVYRLSKRQCRHKRPCRDRGRRVWVSVERVVVRWVCLVVMGSVRFLADVWLRTVQFQQIRTD